MLRMKKGRAIRAIAASDEGAALAELAIILPLLCLLLSGLVEAGRFGYYTILVGNAARAGVQYGSQNLVAAADTSGMVTRALNDAQNAAGLSATASSACTCADGTASTCLPTDCSASHMIVYVQVTATASVPSLLNFPALPASLPTLNVSNTATMRVSPVKWFGEQW